MNLSCHLQLRPQRRTRMPTHPSPGPRLHQSQQLAFLLPLLVLPPLQSCLFPLDGSNLLILAACLTSLDLQASLSGNLLARPNRYPLFRPMLLHIQPRSPLPGPTHTIPHQLHRLHTLQGFLQDGGSRGMHRAGLTTSAHQVNLNGSTPMLNQILRQVTQLLIN